MKNTRDPHPIPEPSEPARASTEPEASEHPRPRAEATESFATESMATATIGSETLGSLRPAPELKRGDSLGRYLLLELVGRGSMGQVYSGYDPKLDRRVALKVLPAKRGQHEALRARLIREARSLARLNHPNVVSVFDAEATKGRVFIATEFVVGKTFSAWLRAEHRPRADILEVLCQAGRGLAAAHEAGLVHRDFKGSNVMVADDGRVLVLDFGLARQLDETASRAMLPEQAAAEHERSSDQNETRTGAVLGTPAFMAPEQRLGATVGPAADQFSFCTVAFQALTGVLPKDDVDGSAAASLEPRLRQVLEQGLAASPDARHASVSALLEKLAPNTVRRRRRWQAAALAATIVAIGFGWWQHHARQQARCEAGTHLFAEVWHPERRERLHTSLSRGDQPSAAQAAVWRSVTGGLDAYAAAWAQTYRGTCEATERFGRRSRELLDLRMDCLDRRLEEVDAALETLADGTPGRLDAAPRLVGNLTPIALCRDTRALRSPAPAPDDPSTRRQLDELRTSLASLKAWWLVGDYTRGQHEAEALRRAARALGYWPLTAEVLIERARFFESRGHAEDANRALIETVLAAQAGGHARIAAEALVRRVRVQGYLLGQVEDAAETAAQAQAVLERLSEPAPLSAELDEVRGLLAVRQGHFDEARQRFVSALETKSELYGAIHLRLAPTLSRLGDIALDQGQLERAQSLLERALAINRLHLGGDHPNVAGTLAQLGALAIERGAFESALSHHSEALEIRRRALGEHSSRVAMSLTDTANALSGLGRHAQAVARFEQAAALFEDELGSDHPFLAIAQSNLAAAYVRQARPDQALPLYQRALEIQRRTYDAEHPNVLQTTFNLAEVLRRTGQRARAITLLQQVIRHTSPRDGALPALQIDAKTALGEAYLDLGRAERALPLLEGSLAARAETDRRPDLWAKNAFALARALQMLDREPERASSLASAALERYRRGSASYLPEIEAIETWLVHEGPRDVLGDSRP